MAIQHVDYISIVRQNSAPAAPQRPQAKPRGKLSRKDRLALALAYTDRAGISRANAYPPFLAFFAAIGLRAKPMHYRSFVGLFLFGFILFLTIFGGTLVTCVALDLRPRPIRAMIDLGPRVFLAGTAALAFIYAASIKMQAIQAGLPRWRDL